jgi:tetratricopeptide (TPR) repeat protein
MRLKALIVLLLLCAAMPLAAQDTRLPASYRLDGITHIYQGWNNCGPATITMGLTYFGYTPDQNQAARWLKPNAEDKNVSPWQMRDFVNTQTSAARALLRYGGTQERLKTLIANQFPVIIEAGYDPVSAAQGWMGHYLLVTGYDDGRGVFITQDSYDGPNLAYTYAHVQEHWKHFNYVYIVLYPFAREDELMRLLGSDADETMNAYNTLALAQADAIANREDPFAWFNIGSSYVLLGRFAEAAAAYDVARNTPRGLPWRMNWYQFGMFEAYLETGRYEDVIALARANLNDGGGQFVEETFYYGALARLAMGQRDRALENLNGAISFNPNFTPAREARDRLLSGS